MPIVLIPNMENFIKNRYAKMTELAIDRGTKHERVYILYHIHRSVKEEANDDVSPAARIKKRIIEGPVAEKARRKLM